MTAVGEQQSLTIARSYTAHAAGKLLVLMVSSDWSYKSSRPESNQAAGLLPQAACLQSVGSPSRGYLLSEEHAAKLGMYGLLIVRLAKRAAPFLTAGLKVLCHTMSRSSQHFGQLMWSSYTNCGSIPSIILCPSSMQMPSQPVIRPSHLDCLHDDSGPSFMEPDLLHTISRCAAPSGYQPNMLSSKWPGPGGITSGCTSPLPVFPLAPRWKSSGRKPCTGICSARCLMAPSPTRPFSRLRFDRTAREPREAEPIEFQGIHWHACMPVLWVVASGHVDMKPMLGCVQSSPNSQAGNDMGRVITGMPGGAIGSQMAPGKEPLPRPRPEMPGPKSPTTYTQTSLLRQHYSRMSPSVSYIQSASQMFTGYTCWKEAVPAHLLSRVLIRVQRDKCCDPTVTSRWGGAAEKENLTAHAATPWEASCKNGVIWAHIHTANASRPLRPTQA